MLRIYQNRVNAWFRADNQGLRLNRTSGLTEYLISPAATPLGSGDTNALTIWFQLHSLSSVQCIYTSRDTSFRVAWMEVNVAGDLIAYWTGSTGGSYQTSTLATGLTANTLYCIQVLASLNSHLVILNGTILNGGSAITTQLGFFHNNVILGARRYVNGSVPPTGGSQLLGASTDGYWNHANMTVYEVAVYGGQTLTSNERVLQYNSGRGLRANKRRLGMKSPTHYYLFDAGRLSSGAFQPLVGTIGMSLVQSSFQELQFRRRFGNSLW